jgi:hypothetical protein
MNSIEAQRNHHCDRFKANAEAMRAMVDNLEQKVAATALGGGQGAGDKDTARGKPRPRDRCKCCWSRARRSWRFRHSRLTTGTTMRHRRPASPALAAWPGANA